MAAILEKPRLLIVEDEMNLRAILRKLFSKKDFNVEGASQVDIAKKKFEQENFDVVILDINLPDGTGLEFMEWAKKRNSRSLFIVMTAQDTMQNAVDSMKKGAFEYITKPFDLSELEQLVEQAIKSQSLSTNHESRIVSNKKLSSDIQLIGRSKSIQEIYKVIGKLSTSHVPVLINGESGTGKELIARSIHQNSNRSAGPFVAVNCAAIPKDLLESEFFGYRKGSFTGATEDRMGYFERAHGGTLFLDEIGDMPLMLQAKLLRVLQEHEVQRLGSEQPRKVDVRLISATHQNLQKKVEEKSFREDLYFRVNVIPIKVPSLRERVEDVALLLKFFLNKFAQEIGEPTKDCTAAALKLLQNYPWPGNIRELENVLKRATVLSQYPTLDVDDFAPLLADGSQLNVSKGFDTSDLESLIEKKIKTFFDQFDELKMENLYELMLQKLERPLIRLVLKKLSGNQIKSAKVLGINRNTLRKKIKELDIQLSGKN